MIAERRLRRHYEEQGLSEQEVERALDDYEAANSDDDYDHEPDSSRRNDAGEYAGENHHCI